MPAIETVIVAVNFMIFFIPKADRIASSLQVSGSWKAALGNLVLAVVIDYRQRDFRCQYLRKI
jgi:hypothetical protein